MVISSKAQNSVATGQLSEFTTQVLFVTESLCQSIYKQIVETDSPVPRTASRAMLSSVFKAGAVKFGITESTVRDKCTRQLGVNTDEFFSLCLNYISSNGHTNLENVIISKLKSTDNKNTVLQSIQKIRKNSNLKFTAMK